MELVLKHTSMKKKEVQIRHLHSSKETKKMAQLKMS